MKISDISRPEGALDVQGLGRTLHELLILAVLGDGPKHGYQIALDVETRTDGAFRFRHGTLYPILHRLERHGRIAGRWDRASGRRRKVYAISQAGRSHLEDEGARLLGGLDSLRRLLEGKA